MHENAVMESVLDIVLAYQRRMNLQRICAITIKAGDTRNLDLEWMQRYFNYYSRGTAAENATIKLEVVPFRLQCADCGSVYSVDWRALETEDEHGHAIAGPHNHADMFNCPNCASQNYRLISGRELAIESIEAI